MRSAIAVLVLVALTPAALFFGVQVVPAIAGILLGVGISVVVQEERDRP
jgi:hypothetical protein